MTFNPDSFKSQFPLFAQASYQSLVYVDNAATTQKPHCVIDAIRDFYLYDNGNANRASHRLARQATESIDNTRQRAAEFMGAAHKNDIVFTHGATEALNMVAYGLGYLFDGVNDGDKSHEIVLSHTEHHANLLPWQRLAKENGCDLVFIPHYQGQSDWLSWRSVINSRTRIVVLSGASNVTGDILDIGLIKAIKQSFPQVFIVLDASQLAAHQPLCSDQWQCDAVVCSAHKCYGPTGVGILYLRNEHIAKMKPLIVGGEMVDRAGLHDSHFQQDSRRLEAGTSPISAIAGLGACLAFWQQQDRVAMMAYEQQLCLYLHKQLAVCCEQYNDCLLLTQAQNNVGIATLAMTSDRNSVSDLGMWLDEHHIAVRVGELCAQPFWTALNKQYGVNRGLRISLAAYNTSHDIDRLIAALHDFFALEEYPAASFNSNHWGGAEWQDMVSASSWQQRYKLLLKWGQSLPRQPAIRNDQYLVKGCETDVWLHHELRGQQYYFSVDSDSKLIKGLSLILLMHVNGKTTRDIDRMDIEAVIDTLGLSSHLSASRMNGFYALKIRIYQFANVPTQ